eukprot:326132-Prymnesium_polylepis.1
MSPRGGAPVRARANVCRGLVHAAEANGVCDMMDTSRRCDHVVLTGAKSVGSVQASSHLRRYFDKCSFTTCYVPAPPAAARDKTIAHTTYQLRTARGWKPCVSSCEIRSCDAGVPKGPHCGLA